MSSLVADKIPQLFGVDKITNKMTLDITKITENPNGLLMQTHHEDKYALAKYFC